MCFEHAVDQLKKPDHQISQEELYFQTCVFCELKNRCGKGMETVFE